MAFYDDDQNPQQPPPTYIPSGDAGGPSDDDDEAYRRSLAPSGPSPATGKKQPLDLISQYESQNRNVPNYRYDPTHTAQGYYQITNTNWRNIGPQMGVDLKQYPSAMAAPREIQAKVAGEMYRRRGYADWAPFNPQLRAAIARGEGSDQAPQRPQTSGEPSDEEAYQRSLGQSAPAPQTPETQPETPQQPTQRPLSPYDYAWHLGVDPSEVHTWNKATQKRAAAVVREAVDEDERKKAAGQTIAPPPLDYQNQMRRQAKIPEIQQPSEMAQALIKEAATGQAQTVAQRRFQGFNQPQQIAVRPQPFRFNDSDMAARDGALRDELRNQVIAENQATANRRSQGSEAQLMANQAAALQPGTAVSDEVERRFQQIKQNEQRANSPVGKLTQDWLNLVHQGDLFAPNTSAEERTNFARGLISRIAETAAPVLNVGKYVSPALAAGELLAPPQYNPSAAAETARQVAAGAQAQGEATKPTSTFGQIRRGLGEGAGRLSVDLPALIGGGAALGTLGKAVGIAPEITESLNLPLQGALSGSEQGAEGIVKGVAGGLVYHYGGGVTGPYLGQIGNSLLWIGAPAAEAHYIHGQPWSQAIGENLPMGLFAGITGGGERAQVYENGELRNARIRDLPAIARGDLRLEPPPQPGVSQTPWVPKNVSDITSQDKPVIVTAPALRAGDSPRAAMLQRGPEGRHFFTEIAPGKADQVAERNQIADTVPVSSKDFGNMVRGTQTRIGQVSVRGDGQLERNGEALNLRLNSQTGMIEPHPAQERMVSPLSERPPTEPTQPAEPLKPETAPETKGAIRAQMQALLDARGNRSAVVADPGTELPTIPEPLKTIQTDDGRTVIYHPDVATPEEIKDLAENKQTSPLIMGHANPDTPDATRVVVARAGKDIPNMGIKAGDELMRSRVTPGNEQPMLAEMQAQFPREQYGTQVVVGGEKTIREGQQEPPKEEGQATQFLNPRFEGQTDAQLQQAAKDLAAPTPYAGKLSRAEAKAQRSRRQQRLEAVQTELENRATLPKTNPRFEALDDQGLEARRTELKGQLDQGQLPQNRVQRARTELNQIATEQQARNARKIAPQVWRHGHFGDLVADSTRSAPRGKFWAYERNKPDVYHLVDRESGMLQPTGEKAPEPVQQSVTPARATAPVEAPAKGQLFATAPTEPPPEAKEGETTTTAPKTLAEEPPQIPPEKQRGTLEFGRKKQEFWRNFAAHELAKAQVNPHYIRRTGETEPFDKTAERVLREMNQERKQSLALDVHNQADRETLRNEFPAYTLENLKEAIEKKTAEIKKEAPPVPETAEEKTAREAEEKKILQKQAQSERQAGKVPGVKRSDPTKNSLAEEAAAMGGVTHDKDGTYRGEVTSLAEGNVRGLVNHRTGSGLEDMATTLAQEGYGANTWANERYGNGIDLNGFIEALNQDASGARREYSNQYEPDTSEFDRQEEERWLMQMSSEERDEYLQNQKFLSNPKVKRLLEGVRNGDTSAKTTREIRAIAKRRGIADDVVNDQIRTAQKARDTRQGERRTASEGNGADHPESAPSSKAEGSPLAAAPPETAPSDLVSQVLKENQEEELPKWVTDWQHDIADYDAKVTKEQKSGPSPEDLEILLKRAAVRGAQLYFQKVKPTFKEWSRKLRDEFDPRINQHLRDIWAQITAKESQKPTTSELMKTLERIRSGKRLSEPQAPPVRPERPSVAEPAPGIGTRQHVEQLESRGFMGGSDREYQKISLDQERAKARSEITPQNLDEKIKEVAGTTTLDHEHVARTQAALEEATRQGIRMEARDPQKALELFGKVAALSAKKASDATTIAQALASEYLPEKMTPEGVLVEAQRVARPSGGLTPEQTRDFTMGADRYRRLEAALEDANRQILQLRSKTSAQNAPGRPITQKTAGGKAEDFVTRLEANAAEAQARIEATRAAMKRGELEFRAAGPMDPVIATHLKDYMTIGAAKMARKTLTLAEWSAEMVKDFGEEIRPHLDEIRNGAAKMVRDERRRDQELKAIQKAASTLPKDASPDVVEAVKREMATRAAEQRKGRSALTKVEEPVVNQPKGPGRRERAIINGIATAAGDDAPLAASALKLSRGTDLKTWQTEMEREHGIKPDSPEANELLQAGKRLSDQAKSNVREQMTLDRLSKGIPDDATPEQREQLINERRQDRDYLAEARRIQKRELERKLMELKLDERGKVQRFMEDTVGFTSVATVRGLEKLIIGMRGADDFRQEVGRFLRAGMDVGVSGVTGRPRTVAFPLRGQANAIYDLITKGPGNVGKALIGKPSEVMPSHGGATGKPWFDAFYDFLPHMYGAKEAWQRTYTAPESRFESAYVLATNDVKDGVIPRGQKNARVAQYLTEPVEDFGPKNQRLLESWGKDQAGYEVRQGMINSGYEKTRADILSKNPDQMIEAKGIRYAEERAYAQNNLVSDLAREAPRVVGRAAGRAGRRFGVEEEAKTAAENAARIGRQLIMPVAKRPVNFLHNWVMDQMGAGVPIHGARIIGQAIKGNVDLKTQEQFMTSVANGVPSWALFAGLGAYLAKKGVMTPAGDEEKYPTKAGRAAGWQPGAILWHGRYWNVGQIPGAGWMMAIGATAELQGWKAVPYALLRVIKEHPLLRTGDWIKEHAENGIGQILKGEAMRFVPFSSPLRQTAEAVDTRFRKTKTLEDEFKNLVPGKYGRERLPAVVDSLSGKEVEKPHAYTFDPFKSTKAIDTPLLKEMMNIGAKIQGPKQQGWESPEGFRERQQNWGREFEQRGADLIDNPHYQDADIKTRNAMLQDLARRIASAYPPEEAPPELKKSKLDRGEKRAMKSSGRGLPRPPKTRE